MKMFLLATAMLLAFTVGASAQCSGSIRTRGAIRQRISNGLPARILTKQTVTVQTVVQSQAVSCSSQVQAASSCSSSQKRGIFFRRR